MLGFKHKTTRGAYHGFKRGKSVVTVINGYIKHGRRGCETETVSQDWITSEMGEAVKERGGHCFESRNLKPIFHLATLFARREAKTRIRQGDWLKLAGEKIRREQVGSVLTILSVRSNKFAKWKMGFKLQVLYDDD